MKKWIFCLSVSLLLLGSETVLAQVKSSSHKAPAKESISAINTKFMQAWSNGNAGGIAALFTSEGMLMPPNVKSVKGHTAISNFFSNLISTGFSTLNLEAVQSALHDKSGHEIGKYTVSDGNGQSVDAGKYIAILRKENGQWKIQSFIYNSDLTPSMY